MTSSRPALVGKGPIRLESEPEPIALDPITTALVVVDMQNAYLSKGRLSRPRRFRCQQQWPGDR